MHKSFGFGSFDKKSILHMPIHFFFQKLIFDNKIFRSREYQIFKKLCDLQNRQIDTHVIRHIFTFNLLNKYKLLKKKNLRNRRWKSKFYWWFINNE